MRIKINSLAAFLVLLAAAGGAFGQESKTGGEPQADVVRTWTDATGKFKLQATFVDFQDGRLKIKKQDGAIVSLPLTKLSKADQRFVSELLRKRRAAANAPKNDSKSAAQQGAGRASASADWPWWRGPNSNGVAAAGQTPPTSWGDQKNIIWKAPLPSRGHGSPTIVGDRIFLATADEQRQVQSVVCLSRSTGEPKWKTDLSQGGFPKIHSKNTHASQTVACDGERIFASFFHHEAIHLYALDLQGKTLWHKVAGPFNPKQYEYGYAASPLIYDEVVIVSGEYEKGGFIVAYDRRKGNEIWRTPRSKQLSFSSPIVAKVAGRDQLLLSGANRVSSYDPKNGRPLWSCAGTTNATCGTMVWEGDLVFASGGYPKSETLAVRADGSGQVVWRNGQKCYEQSMLVHNGHVYAITDAGVAYCWRAGDGQEMWKARLGGPVSASPILASGNIYLSNERGQTFVFRADPRGFELVSRNRLGDESFATPTICGNRIYLRIAEHGAGRQEYLVCIGGRE